MPALPHLRLQLAPIALLAALLASGTAPGTAHAEARRAAQSLPMTVRFSPAPPSRVPTLSAAPGRTPARLNRRDDSRAPLARARSGGKDNAKGQAGLMRRDERGPGQRRPDQPRTDQRRLETRHNDRHYGDNHHRRREFEEAEKRESHHLEHHGRDDSPGC